MNRKIRIAVLYGGRSAEHEVSIQSAKNIVRALDRNKYEVSLIAVSKEGRWMLDANEDFFLEQAPCHLKPCHLKLPNLATPVNDLAILPGLLADRSPITCQTGGSIPPIDVVFPVLHGPFGEDGTVQGLLKLVGVPYVGPDILGSAAAMDKEVSKRLLRDAGIPVADFVTVTRRDLATLDTAAVVARLGLPLFVKPANLGSSVGISKVADASKLKTALEEALQYDRKALVERFIKGREIECSVLGNQDPIASVPGEIIPQHEFYSYEAKYLDENGALLQIPADLPPDIVKRVQELAIAAFKAHCCEGMSRVDFFLTPSGELIVNELNTIPGFTKISMYPKLWEASGISYAELLDRLIQLALERHAEETRLRTNFT